MKNLRKVLLGGAVALMLSAPMAAAADPADCSGPILQLTSKRCIAEITGPAQVLCIVADPSPTPLNIRTVPYGRIVGTLDNGQVVSILDGSTDIAGRPWAYVADDTGIPLGWVYREYVVCKGEAQP
jgi:Bacterial SH3 domain